MKNVATKTQSIAPPTILWSTPLQREFQTANEAGLSGPFTAADEIINGTKAPQNFAVLLHSSYDEGDAVGYTQELIAVMKVAFPHVKAKQIRWEYFGSAIRGRSLFLLGSKKPVHIDSAKQKKTVFTEYLPTCLRHAPKNFNLNSLENHLGNHYSFEYSHLHALPEIELWANKRLVIEELIGSRIDARRLTKEEIAGLYGAETIMEVNDMVGWIPQVVVDTLYDVILNSMED